jgi:hypothetical protein
MNSGQCRATLFLRLVVYCQTRHRRLRRTPPTLQGDRGNRPDPPAPRPSRRLAMLDLCQNLLSHDPLTLVRGVG